MKFLIKICFISIFWINTAIADKPLTVVLDWLVNPDHAPLFVAQQQGFFAEQGLEVTLIAPANSADPLKLVAANQADIAISYQPQFMFALDKGLPLMRIGTLIATPLNVLLVLEESDIKTIPDLKGKNIAYTPGGSDDIMLRSMLKHYNLSLKDVNLINVNYNLTQALLTKKVDAITGVMRNIALIEIELKGQKVRAFYPEEYGVPVYDELIFVTKNNQINDPRLRKFMNAMDRAVQYLINHPDTMWQAFAKQYPLLNNTFNERAWNATLTRFSLMPGALDHSRYQTLTEFMFTNQWIKKAPALETYAMELPMLPTTTKSIEVPKNAALRGDGQ